MSESELARLRAINAELLAALGAMASVMTVARGHLWAKADTFEGLRHDRGAADLRNVASKLTDHIEAARAAIAAATKEQT